MADEGQLTEAECLAPLTEGHPAIVALTERLARAEGELRAATLLNPELGFDREAPDGATSQSVYWLSWQPPVDGRRGLRKRAAEAGMRAAASDFDWAKLQLRVTLRAAYAQWALSVERRDILSEHVAKIRRLAERARVRAETGEEAGLDARRLALAAAEVQSELALAEAGVTRVGGTIRVLQPKLAAGVRPVRPAMPGVPSNLDWSERPDVEARRSETQQAEFERRLSGRVLEPPGITAGWTRLDEASGTVAGPVFGVSWSLPLFDRNQGRRAEAARNVAIAEAQLELAEARAQTEFDVAHAVYAQLRVAATQMMAGTADADGLVASAAASFDAGEATLTDLLETLRSVLSTRLAALELYYNALEAHRDLEASAGRSLSPGGMR